jgi:tetratricopeptide (TPR) repeat protein
MLSSNQENKAASLPARRLALVVGVNGASQTSDYLAPLQFAESSATDLAQVLQEKCNFELLAPLIGNEATTSAIQNAIRKLAFQRTDQDFLLFYFTGHGYPMSDEAGQHNVYLVTQDFDPSMIEELDDGALSLAWLSEILYKKTKAGSVLIILDCCYGGNANTSLIDRPLDTIHDALKQYFSASASSQMKGKTRATLSAAGRDAVAWERDGYSVMASCFLGVLRGEYPEAVDDNGQVTLGLLESTLRTRMPSDQKLSFSGEVVGNPLILATLEGFSARTRREREYAVQRVEREHRLRAMFADHSGFLQDRLASFVGREKELTELDQRIKALLPKGGYITITGQPGQGKSSVIAKLIETYSKEQDELDRVAYHFIPLNPGPDHQVALLRNVLARLILKHDLSEIYADSVSRAALREAFPKVLKEIADKGRSEIIFIDGLDQLEMETTGSRDLTFLPHGTGNPPAGIVFVLGTRPNDTLRPLELLKQRDEVKLPNLSRADFDRILHHRHVPLERTLADNFYEQLEQNALYLDLVAKELAERSSITAAEIAAIIQQITDNPENLFSLATDRLSMQEKLWAEVTKPILGLLLVTNQPLSSRQIKQLINLSATAQVDSERLNRGLDQLGGLIIADGQQRYTLFHLKFRDYLREDPTRPGKRYIFDSEDERSWHQCFVSWCEQDGLARIWDDVQTDSTEQERRLYARQHYITHLYFAGDWNKLFQVLDDGAYGKAKVQHDPSTRSYALDLDVGRQAATSDKWGLTEAIQHLPHLWRYTLLRCSLASRADNYPVEAFELMLLLEQETKALGLAELITDSAKKVDVFILIGSYFATQAGREREARQMFTRAEERAKTIEDEHVFASTLLDLVSAFARLGQWEEAATIVIFITSEWEHDAALVVLATAYAQAQQWQQAEAAIASIQGDAKREEALVALTSAYAQAGLWSQCERWIAAITEKQPHNDALVALASAYAQAGQWQEAEQCITSILDMQQHAEALTALASAYGKVGQSAQATQAWRQAEQCIALITDDWKRAVAMMALAAIYAQTGSGTQAKQAWLQTEQYVTAIQGEYWHAKAVEALSIAYAQAGYWSQAEETIASISDQWRRVKVLVMLATSCVQARQLQRARRVWQQAEAIITSVQGNPRRVMVMAALAAAYTLAGQGRKAHQAWQQAEATIASIPGDLGRAEAAAALAMAYTQMGQTPQAEATIAFMQGTGEGTEVLVALATAYAQAGQWTQAEETIASIQDAWGHDKAMAALATAYAQTGQWQQAEQSIDSIANRWQRIKAQVALVDAYARAGQTQQATQIYQQVEATIASTEDKWGHIMVADTIATTLATTYAQSGQWQLAEEKAIASIQDEDARADALKILADALTRHNEYEKLLRLVHRWWLEADTNDKAIRLFPLAFGFIAHYPDVGAAFQAPFAWVDDFLRG